MIRAHASHCRRHAGIDRRPHSYSANIQDRDGAATVLKSILKRCRGSDISSPMAATQAEGRAAKGRYVHSPDRQTDRQGQGLRSPAPSLGRGTRLRMAWQKPKIGQGLGEINRFRRSLDYHRPHPHPNPTPRKILLLMTSFRVSLLRQGLRCVWKFSERNGVVDGMTRRIATLSCRLGLMVRQ